jgi:hypothetical protein
MELKKSLTICESSLRLSSEPSEEDLGFFPELSEGGHTSVSIFLLYGDVFVKRRRFPLEAVSYGDCQYTQRLPATH